MEKTIIAGLCSSILRSSASQLLHTNNFEATKVTVR